MQTPDGIVERRLSAPARSAPEPWRLPAEAPLSRPGADRWLPPDAAERAGSIGEFRAASLHDALTGLPSRALFLDRLGQAARHARRHRENLVVALLSLAPAGAHADRPAPATADAALCGATQRLRACLRQTDTVARLGPCEFGLVLPGVADAAQAHRTLRKLRDALDPSLTAQPPQRRWTLTLGASLCDGGEGELNQWLGQAEEALERAARQGPDACVLHQHDAGHAVVWGRGAGADTAARPLLARHAQPALQALLRQMPVVRRLVRCGDHLFRAGERFEGPYVLHAGSVKMLAAAPGGRQHVVALHLSGDWFGFDGLADGRHDSDAVATDTGEVWLLQHDALLLAAAREPALLKLLHAEIGRAARRERDARLALNALPVEAKVAAFLCRHVQDLAERGMRPDELRLRLSRAELGDYLDMTLESVSRAMSQLSRRGLIGFGPVGRRVILIPDLPALEAFVRARRRAEPVPAGTDPGGDEDERDTT
ncbi:MAG: diguanylate cyclase [Burkholderiales bacterium]|nr:diguanylate cyclase [Burkholderiales bacterium]